MAVRSRSRSLSRSNTSGSRQRRLSFGEEKPSKSAPIVGSLVARRDEAVRRERRRSRSADRKERFHSLSKGFGLGQAHGLPLSRSSDNLSHHRRTTSCTHPRNAPAIDYELGTDTDLSVALDQGSSTRGSRTHHHTRSDPDLLNFSSRNANANARLRSQPLRVRMRAPDDVVVIGPDSPPPPRIDFSKPLPPLPRDRTPRPGSFPLPPGRDRDGHARDVDVGIALTSDQPTPSPARIGERVMSDSMDSMTRYSGLTHVHSPSTADARAELDRQHKRDQTRRAFAAPAGPTHRLSTNGPKPTASSHIAASAAYTSSTAGLLNSSTRTQTTQATESTDVSSMHTADLTFPGTVPPTRRLTALEQAIGRSRAASLGSSEGSQSHSLTQSHSHSHSTSQHSATKPAKGTTGQSTGTNSSPRSKASITPTRPPRLPSPAATIPLPETPTVILAPALPHPISPRSSSLQAPQPANPILQAPPVRGGVLSRPLFQHLDTNTSTMTGQTVYTDASEGWSREEAFTPRQEQPQHNLDSGPQLHVSRSDSISTDTEDDFRGLFFRTPKDAAYDRSPLTNSPMPPARLESHSSPAAFPRLAGQDVGLGYDLQDKSASAPTRVAHPLHLHTDGKARPISSEQSADHSIGSGSDPARSLSYGEGTDSDSGIIITPSGPGAGLDEAQATMAAQLRGELPL